MTSISGVGGGGQVPVESEQGGGSMLSGMGAAVLDRAKSAVQERIADLQTRQEGASGAEQAELRGEIERLEGALERLDSMKVGGNVLSQLISVAAEVRGVLAESYSEFGTSVVSGEAYAGETEEREPLTLPGIVGRALDRIPSGVMERIQSVAGRLAPGEAREAEGAAQASGEVDLEDPAQMLELFQNDPEAFYEALKDLPAEDRMMMMNLVQTQMQQINQMFSMMSQLSQAVHDTHKAIINNLRV